ncbi:alpha/beta hydrolase [Deinococcus cellulosilyticus]|uniref:Alpha/beta hydrolase n=1 Tax=Deinococcus cellulosilyticus (strain DSM 18568 / NBRC 106333 / KACC 11606 / 5516J-15) TaxID=1223518 RepID=A0A511MW73_DEIC1|nr:dienelactone hydrolase family protein [Deinococcus cellulosilyticus]GEM44651.1 hypothetical protein DC3_02860 [Deinococcus cellulosilyticus NBRC 106333 = KACC 11606]
MPENFGWIHHYEAGSGDLTLLLLHGTGGNETSLLQIGRDVAPTANLLSVRGRSLDEGSPRFFRRFTDIRYDQEHLKSEAAALADFVKQAAAHYGFDASKVVALGYSNGANIAIASLIRHPDVLAGGVLWRPVMPLEHPDPVSLQGKPLLVTLGAMDHYRKHADDLLSYLKDNASDAQIEEIPTGHQLTRNDLILTQSWLRQHFPG